MTLVQITTTFFRKSQEMTAEACGVSVGTVKRITSEGAKSTTAEPGAGPSFTSPRKSYKRLKYASDIDDFNADIVRRTVHEFYDKGQFPTSQKVLTAYQQKVNNYRGSRISMWRILKSLHFKYKKCNDGRRFLMERNDIVVMRVKFLRKMHDLRQNNDTRPVIYLDETWVNTEGLKVPTGKGSRIIICHAGSSAFGFLKEAKLIFRCKSEANIDFHTQMNSTIFKKWFIEMMQNLEEPCVIVMDNCPYHSVLVQNYPKSNDNKATLQKWFTENGMESASFETLIELRERVKLLKQKDKRYEIDEIALQMGHEVIRLPPYHYQYNPIELIWAQVKGEIAKKNNSFKITDVEKLANIAIESVTVDNWKRCVNHCERLQDEDFIKEGFRDKILEPIVLTINPEDSSESDDDDESLQF
ncbi:Ribonuclease H-like domain [Cinara cedri]|uniref:Ribonuclease H-like domain n=1 Tax=Cinara cedri TaxID=506608 RepID=A0A5E4ME94_9HEMI|nr:Ribonuclease H-like domain [Cinara cedri]